MLKEWINEIKKKGAMVKHDCTELRFRIKVQKNITRRIEQENKILEKRYDDRK